MSPNTGSAAVLLGALLMTYGEIAPGAEDSAGRVHQPSPAPAAVAPLVLSEALTLKQAGGRNPTVAVDRRAGTVYLAWAQEVPEAPPAPPEKNGERADPKLQVLLARSDDGGRRFETPVVMNSPKDRVQSHTVSPTQVAVGPRGEVYVLYSHHDFEFKQPGWKGGRSVLRLARSDDGGRRFAAPIEIGGESVEGVVGSPSMINLFVAPDGALYASWLDYRESYLYVLALKKEPPEGQWPPTQLRVARSTEGGRRFASSTLVTKPVCGCCGTKVAQGTEGPLYASTRAEWPELKSSVDAVRDIIVATSRDHGASWSQAVKVHDDRFKISGCPDVAPGLSVDSRGRLHAAWYTGSERKAGVFYAVSTNGGKSFSAPLALLSDEWVPYADVKLALDASDNAWVAFEDRRGETDLIHLVRVAPDGALTRAKPWPGTIPDVAALGDSVVVAWGGLAPEEEQQGGGIQALIASPGTGP